MGTWGRRTARRRALAGLLGMALVAAACSSHSTGASPTTTEVDAGSSAPAAGDASATTVVAGPPRTLPGSPPAGSAQHPRLWITADELPTLRSWANPANPVWAQALAPLLARSRSEMDAHKVPDGDCGSTEYEEFAAESYAELFAFDSLVDPDTSARADAAQRARSLLMHVIDAAAKGPASSETTKCSGNKQYPAYRSPRFFTEDSNRARYYGEAFPLVVDWIYPTLSDADKQQIHKVFSRWSDEIIARGYHHPAPAGTYLDPQLLSSDQVRWSGNNYYTAHMRNLLMLALSMDPADDAGGTLHRHVDDAVGTWLYVFDKLTRTDAAGGVLPEGSEYSPQTGSYAAQTMLALQTAGVADSSRYGDIVNPAANPFWHELEVAFEHGLSPKAVVSPGSPERGATPVPFAFGDLQAYRVDDPIDLFGSLGVLLRGVGDTAGYDAARWIATNLAPGGADHLLDRAGNPDNLRKAIEYFLLLDPNAPPPADPRPGSGLHHLAAGLGKLSARTGWGDDATWLTYSLPWNHVDHQQADGNDFGLYRKGEWLTKRRTGYADIAGDIASSEFADTVTIQNDQPAGRDKGDWQLDLWQRGSQWNLVPAGDPKLLALSTSGDRIAVTGDATPLYNVRNGPSAVTQATRTLVWLEPDRVVVYDRADTAAPKGPKRFWLQVPAPARIDGKRATVTTPGGQVLAVTTVLPEGAAPAAGPPAGKDIDARAAEDEPMKDRIVTQAPGDPASVRFLHVLQGADQGASLDDVTLVRSDDGAMEGAVVGDTVVLFAVDVHAAPRAVHAAVPAAVRHVVVTGLTPGATYAATLSGGALDVQTGAGQAADEGGVLEVSAA